jgi:predicted phage terminase large subunit-like protein
VNRTDQDFLNSALRADFMTFLHRCVLTLNPGAAFLPNWHLDAIAHVLEKVLSGGVTRLIINAPPRSLKSIMVSVAFPAYALGHSPGKKMFGISYGTDLAAKHASDFRSIVQSGWFERAFPKMQISRSADFDIYTSSRGYRKATSVYATLTGLGGDCFIIDDPLKPIDAQSDAQRNHVNEWFSSTLRSRLDNKATGTIIVVMQRVHLNDLTGYLLEKSGGWTLLSLPAIAESDEAIAIGDARTHYRRAGDVLHPDREPLSVLETTRNELGPDLFEAQYQQRPVPAGGAMIRRAWLRYYHDPPRRTYNSNILQSWDTAAKGGAQNDWSVCTTWQLEDKCFYLLDVTRGRFEYPLLRSTAVALAEKYHPQNILIEDASTGTALAQELRSGPRYYGVNLVPVHHDKVGRLFVQQGKFAAGLVHFPRNAPFLRELETELLTFPQGKNDDQVDSISQALAYDGFGYNLRALAT